MFDLSRIESWQERFGLFTTSIKSNSENQYVLLNGGHNDFCIDLNQNGDIQTYNSYAWSANTKNYLAITDSNVVIHNWDKDEPEILKRELVQNNIGSFYKYIGIQTYQTNNDVVPFILNLFRKMRNLTREKESPVDALSLLHILLLSLEEDIHNLNFEKWAIKEVSIPEKFDLFIEELKKGIPVAQPDLEIILRHSAGPIFQEAHRIVENFSPNRDLFGDIESNTVGTIQLHSSSHYTPQYVSRSIVEQCLKKIEIENRDVIRIFDPACGSGEFLMEILRQLYQKGYKGEIYVKGWDCSESAINTSRFLLNYVKEKNWKERLVIDVCRVNDSLEEDWGIDNDILLMNPPFVSWELLNNQQREIVATLLPEKISKPNQSAAFLQKAINSLPNDGILGCLTPSSLFEFSAYEPLRNQIKETCATCFVAKLGGYVFEDAIVNVNAYVVQKTSSFIVPTLLWCSNEKRVAPNALCALRKMEASGCLPNDADADTYSIYTTEKYPDNQNSWKVLSKNEVKLKESLNNKLSEGLFVEVQKMFTIKQGVRTGYNKLFIINKRDYESMDEMEKGFYRKSIDSKAIKSSKIDVVHYLWYPYNGRGATISSEEQLKREAPITYERLMLHKDSLKERVSLKNKEHWWELSRHRKDLIKKEPRIVSTEFGNSGSFSFDAIGEYMVERGCMWKAKVERDLSDYYFYLAILSSPFFDKLLSIYSRQLTGGKWYDLGAKYINDIPIPKVSICRNLECYDILSDLGEAIARESSHKYLDKLDKYVGELYKLEDYDF